MPLAQLDPELITDLSGGRQDSAAPTAFKVDESSELLNYYVTPDGKAEVRRGSQRTHTTALNSGAVGYGGVEFRLANGTVQWCVFVGDEFYFSTNQGATWTNPAGATGLTEAYWSIVTFRRGSTNWLLASNGGTSSYKWDGTTWSTITGISNNANLLAVHNGRLWHHVAGGGNTVIASAIDDFEVYGISGLQLNALTHEGDNEILALHPFGPILLLGKRTTIAYTEGFGNSDVILATGARGLSDEVGIIAHRSFVNVAGDAAVFLSMRGFEYLALGQKPVLVSHTIQNFMRGIEWEEILAAPGLPQAIFYPDRGTYECSVPAATAQNDTVFVYRLPTPERRGAATLHQIGVRAGATDTMFANGDGYLELQSGTSQSQVALENGYMGLVTDGSPGVYVFVNADGYLELGLAVGVASIFTADRTGRTTAPVAVGYDGFVRVLDDGEEDDRDSDGTDGIAIQSLYQSRPLLFRRPTHTKRGRSIRVNGISDANTALQIAVRADGVMAPAVVVTLPASVAGLPRQVRTMVAKRGLQLQVEIRTSKAGFKIADVEMKAEAEVQVA